MVTTAPDIQYRIFCSRIESCCSKEANTHMKEEAELLQMASVKPAQQ